MQFNKTSLIDEIYYTTSRSSGKGGQHINKVESRVSLFFDVESSLSLSKEQKEIILHSSKVKLNKKGIWQIDVEESRSQSQNKKIAINQFFERLEKILQVPKKRKATKPSKVSIEKRLKEKKINAEKKSNRKFNPERG